MSVQGLMQKGAPGCSKWEKTADIILKFPRGMWLGKNVSVELAKGQATSKPANSFVNGLGKCQGGAFKGLLLIFFAAFSTIAWFPLAIGLACKKIALYRDKKAEDYHQVVEIKLNEGSLIARKGNLNWRKKEIETRLKGIETELVEVDTHSYVHRPLEERPRLIQKAKKRLSAEKQALEAKKQNIEKELAAIEKELPSVQSRVGEIFARYGKQPDIIVSQ